MNDVITILSISLLAVVSFSSLFFAAYVYRSQRIDLGDAIRMLGSRDYAAFAAASRTEARVDRPVEKEPTEADIQAAMERARYEQAVGDPYSQG